MTINTQSRASVANCNVWLTTLWLAGVLDRGRSSMEAQENESPPSTSATSDVVSSIRERTIAENSLVVLLQGVQGQVTTVELRDESSARGRVVNVDAFMNIRLEEVDYRDRRGRPSRLQDLFVTGRNVRYVHIPEHMDIMKTIQGQLAKIHRVRNFAREGGGRKEFAKTKKWELLSSLGLKPEPKQRLFFPTEEKKNPPLNNIWLKYQLNPIDWYVFIFITEL